MLTLHHKEETKRALCGDAKCLPAGVNVKFMNTDEMDHYQIQGWRRKSRADTLDFEGNAERWKLRDTLL